MKTGGVRLHVILTFWNIELNLSKISTIIWNQVESSERKRFKSYLIYTLTALSV